MEPPLEHMLFLLEESIDFMTLKNSTDLHWGLDRGKARIVKS
jgi:hypothetical protein